MLIGLLSVLGVESKNELSLGKINYYIVWLAIIFFTLVIIYLSKSFIISAVSFLLQIIFFKYSYPYLFGDLVDHHGLIYPVTATGFSLLLVYFSKIQKSGWLHIIAYSLAFGFSLGIIALFRNSIGYALLFGGIFSILILLAQKYKNKAKINVAYYLICILIMFLSYKTSYIFSQDLFHKQTKISLGIEGDIPTATVHGIWHNAFIGLGYKTNSWGIRWSDNSGRQFAEKHSPGVKYISEQYFLTLRNLYFQYALENPLEYIKNHMLKFYVILKYIIITLKIPIIFLFLLLVIRNSSYIKLPYVNKVEVRVFVIPSLSLLAIPIMTIPVFSTGFITFMFYALLSLILLSDISLTTLGNKFKLKK